MKKPSRFLRVLGAAGLLISLLAVTITPVAAQDDDVIGQSWLDTLVEAGDAGFLTGNNVIFYPWVANDDDFGLGPADTSISVQNLEGRDTVISVFVGDGQGDFDLVTSAYLSAFAAKTFHASQLGIAPGSGAPVAVVAFNSFDVTGFPAATGVPEAAIATAPGNAIALVETPIILSNPVADDEADGENDGGDSTQVIACVVNAHTSAQPGLGHAHGYVDAQTGAWVSYSTQQELQDTLNAANAGNTGELINPFGGLNNDGDCFDVLEVETLTFDDSVAIGGVAKQAVEGETLPTTTASDTAVSGYNAINGVEMEYFDEWYLPIVQTNCGPGGCWDSILRVANYDSLNNAVTIRFFPADDGSGSLQTGFQVQALVNGGDTWHVNLGDLVPEGWVGSAHIYSDGAVFAMVDRYKVGYNMWITNTGSSADFENLAQVPGANGRYALFAPHVLLDYFGWNTGINVANLVNTDNNISIQYFNLFGNATQVLNQRLAAHGMTYFYDPSIAAQDLNQQDVQSDPNAGVVGSAIIWSDYPVAAAVDATKYPETDPNGGPDLFQATSYSATANIFPWQAVPLVQKGSPADGMGDTSGINILNPNAVAATANVYWVNPSGFLADNFGVSSVTIPGFANGFVYTMTQHNLPNGFLGAAQVVANVPVAAVSANVNYEVDGDGSAIYNAFNPCGLYRVSGACSFGDVFEPGDQSITKTFLDPAGNPVAGVGFQVVSTPGSTDFPYQRDGVSGLDGSRTFANVPVGVYDLLVTSVPAGFAPVDPTEVQETFVVAAGDDVELTNILDFGQGFTKTVIVTGSDLDDDDDTVGVTLTGVDVVVYEQVGTDTSGDPVAGDVVFTGQTDANGQVAGSLAVGNYVLCLFDADGVATLPNGEEVPVDLPGTIGTNPGCDVFTLAAGESESLVNAVDLDGDAGAGVLDIDVFGAANGVATTLMQDDGVPAAAIEIEHDGETFVTDEDGLVVITGLDDGTHTITFNFAGANQVLDAIGGLLNVSNVTNDGLSITFDYNITDDVAQDGVLSDNANDGSSDLSVEVEDAGDVPTGPTGTVTKTFVNVDEDPVSGVDFCLAPTGAASADDCVESAITGSGGDATVTVPVGTYDLFVTAVPTGYELPTGAADTGIEVTEDADTPLTNDLVFAEGVGTVVKSFVNTAGEAITGVEFYIESADGQILSSTATEDPSGTWTFTNVPSGDYDLTVTVVPTGYELPTGVQDEFTLLAGGTVTLTNTLFQEGQDNLLLIGLNADLDALGLAEVTVDAYAVPAGQTCETVVGNSGFELATAINLDAGDFVGLSAGVAALEIDQDLLDQFGVVDENALIGLGICLAISADLGGGEILEADILVPAIIEAVGDNYVANAQLDGATVNLNILSALDNLLPDGLASLDVTVRANTSGSACGDLTDTELAALPVVATDLAGTILPIEVCIEVEANVLGLDLVGAVIGADLTPGAERTLNAGVQLLPLPAQITLSLD